MKPELIAPCGMNCNLCSKVVHSEKYKKNPCPGCKPRGKGCIHGKGLCEKLVNKQIEFCHLCDDYPCRRLKGIDKRYRTRYDCSFIEHLDTIRDEGMDAFLEGEKEKYTCECGKYFSVHSRKCSCGAEMGTK